MNFQFSNFKKLKPFLFLTTIFVFFVFGLDYSFSYSPYNTHPALTEEMAMFFNLKQENLKINNKEIEWMRQGAINEDEPPRWINHFYDPVHKVGWTGKHFGYLSEKQGYKTGADMASKPAIASIDWVENQEYQSSYGAQYGNQTWQFALTAYVSGDKESAFTALGHILHLLEDLSVPDHTRNDTHAGIKGDPGSPYEDYAKEYTNFNKLDVAQDLKNQNKDFHDFQNIRDYFEYLANYTNNNFFSEDTISNEEFGEPDLEGLEIVSKEIEGNIIRKYLIFNDNYLSWFKKEEPLTGKKIYTTDDKYFVLPSYRFHLFPQAVLVGASVINQFFKEAEYYKQNPELLEPIEADKYQSFSFNLKRSPKIIGLKALDFADKNSIAIKVALFEAKNKITNLANTVSSKLKSIFTNNAQSQQAGPGPLVSNFMARPPSLNEQNEQTAGEVDNDNLSTDSGEDETTAVNSAESELSVLRVRTKPTNSKTRQTVSENLTARSPSLQNNNATNNLNTKGQSFINRTAGYSPGFGGGDAVSSFANASEDTQTNSNSQSQNSNSGTSTENGSGSENSQNQNSASLTENESGSQSQNSSASSTNAASTKDTTADTTAPSPPIITSPSNLNQTFTSQILKFQGTAEASSTLLARSDFISEATTSVSGSGNWSLVLNLAQGSTTVDFFAVDKTGNISSSTRAEIFIDSTAPQIASFKILECESSLATDGCLIATTTLNLAWSADASDLDYFELAWNSESEGQAALVLRSLGEEGTSTRLTLNEGEHTLSLRAKDYAGNFSNQQTLTLEINLKPLVINEVAWAGTGRETSNDEWIELYNRTNKTINLNNFALYAEDLAPYINLQKRNSQQNTLAPKSYYLLERTNDETISDILADQFFTGALNNRHENLYLVYAADSATTTIDYTYFCNTFQDWCGGSNDFYTTMERYSPYENYWGTNIEIIKNGRNERGALIKGTPASRNSLNYLISRTNQIQTDIVLTKQNSPYLIYNTITVLQGATLKIEPGVVIKVKDGPNIALDIYGELEATGNEDDSIVFTGLRDDEYFGDLNGDGAETSPRAGDWSSVYLRETSSSTVSFAKFKYGGGSSYPCCAGMLKIENATGTITNSDFEHSYSYGLELINSNSYIANNVFKNNNNYPQFQLASGIYIGGGQPKVINNIFPDNYIGLTIGGANEAEVANNIFNNNLNKAISVSGNNGIGSFKNNSGILAGGVSDGIYVSNLRLLANATTTLYSNSLPYIFHNNPNIPVGTALVVEPYVLIKNTSVNRIEVYGALETKGESPDDIVFTSLNESHDSWFGISANPESRVSLFGTTVKNGGNIFGWGAREKEAALYADNAEITIENSLFADNYNNGAFILNSKSQIKNSEFKNHTKPDLNSRGLAYYDSTINLNNVEFRNNFLGLYANPASLLGTIVSPLIFEGNASTSNIWLGL